MSFIDFGIPEKTASGIFGFKDEYRWLSNFWILDNPIIFDNIEYNSVENAYVASKTNDIEIRKLIALLAPNKAKMIGKELVIIDNFNKIKSERMKELVLQKFIKNEDLKLKLLNTKDLYIEETNTWKDVYWGVCNGVGKNILGKIIMEVRSILK